MKIKYICVWKLIENTNRMQLEKKRKKIGKGCLLDVIAIVSLMLIAKGLKYCRYTMGLYFQFGEIWR